MGGNVRFVRNDRTSYANAFPTISFSRGNLNGLGSDIVGSRRTISASSPATPVIRLTDGSTWLARVRQPARVWCRAASMTYSFDRDGNPLPVGAPTAAAVCIQRIRSVCRRHLADDAESDAELRPALRQLRRSVRAATVCRWRRPSRCRSSTRSASPAWRPASPAISFRTTSRATTSSARRTAKTAGTRRTSTTSRLACRRLQPDAAAS